MNELVSETTFKWILTGLTGAACLWALYDIFKWRNTPSDDPHLNDKRFGYSIGILLGAFGISGLLKFHGVF